MKYFIDTEFIEGPQKESFPISLFRKETPSTIDLISIGIVAEDSREYYVISKDFNLKEAWNRFQIEQVSGDQRNIFPEGRKVYWLRENVLKPIWRELFFEADDCSGLSNKQTERFFEDINSGDYDHYFTFDSCKFLINKYGKTNKEIANEVEKFCKPNQTKAIYYGVDGIIGNLDPNTEFYAYYADYDWVVFCWLFGKMIDLPKGFPMYCKDLKQIMDEKQSKIDFNTSITEPRKDIKSHKDYPKQDSSKSHNAIEDARWNKKLYEFLTQL